MASGTRPGTRGTDDSSRQDTGLQSRRWFFTRAVLAVFAALWWIVALPFRLVFWTIAWMGRLVGAILGFSLMVGGMALLAGPYYVVGVPLFVIGLVVTLRSLD
jgi:hypothetical protein